MAQPVIGIVGLGTMGLGIAQVFAQAGFMVVATDAMPAAQAGALLRLADSLSKRIAAGKLTLHAADAARERLRIVPDFAALASAGLVIEAVAEDLAAKQSLFSAVEAAVASDTVLATNTSSLSVAAIAAPLLRPDRLLGLHFFNPAPAMKLVELVAHPGASPGALSVARQLTEAAGKTVIACADRPGFIVNRCARPYYGEALALLEEGRGAADVDAAMLATGYRLGPFALIDLIGADINLAATKGLAAAMAGHPRYHLFRALQDQVARGDLGRKSRRGFIDADNQMPAPVDTEAIALRIEATLANEAAYLLAEGGVTEVGIDTAMRLGLNFPHGPFEAARRWGLPRILATLTALEAAAPPHLVGRYVVCPALRELE